MTEDKPQTERTTAEGHEVFVTKDESGITALAEEEDAADPRVVPDSPDEAEGGDEERDAGS